MDIDKNVNLVKNTMKSKLFVDLMEQHTKIHVTLDAMKPELLMKVLAQQPDFLVVALLFNQLFTISMEFHIKMHALQTVMEKLQLLPERMLLTVISPKFQPKFL